jgi:hypothetical protein
MTVDLDALGKKTEELLHSRGVFDVDAYGWLNENDVDPEFVGYAMWALSSPYDHDFESWQNDTPPSRAPTETEQRQMELGHDFFGLMKTARHFIGYALLHQLAVRPLRVEPTEFDFNEFAALTALTAAADRLRDFIIVTALEIKAKSGNQAWEQLNKACDKLRASSFAAEADDLQKRFKAIHDEARKARNKAVHELATQPAHVQRQLISMDREAFEKQRWHDARDREVPYEEELRELKQLDAKELAEVEAHAKLLCDCHVKLVKLGELCFRTELNWRQRRVTAA